MKTPAYRACRWERVSFCGGSWLGILAAVAGLLAASLAGAARAQNAQEPPPGAEAGKTAPALPEPEDVDRLTSDALAVHATYFKSTQKANSVPVLLLHSWKSDGRREFEELARYLQAQGHAVLVPDLRGHGRSATFEGTGAQMDPAKMRNADFANMVTKDMEAWRSFLVQQNNDKKLNLNKLCLVGSEMGAAVALHWALLDWNWSAQSAGQRRPSVAALVLLSPQTNFRGLDIGTPLANPAVCRLSIMILVGRQDAKAGKDANQLYSKLLKYHPQPPAGLDKQALADWEADKRDLFFRPLDTKLQGSKMLGIPSLQVPERIAVFIDWRLGPNKSRDFPWQEIGKKK